MNGDKLKSKDKALIITVGNNNTEVTKTVVNYKDEGFKAGEFSALVKSIWPNIEEEVDGNVTMDARIILGK